MASAPLTLGHKPSYFESILNMFRSSRPATGTAARLDARTIRAIEHLPPYLLKDIGVTDF